MNLYLLRHAIALDRSAWKKADSDRPLTDHGVRKMKRIARGVLALDVKVDAILTSPYRRAYDTAAIVARAMDAEAKLRISRSLASDGDPKALVRHLARDFRTWESILLVGHEPYLGRLAGTLTAGSPEVSLTLKKGGICLLAADALTYGRCATLEWLIPPRILRRLAR
jgi:phosphohistidine phosphatase